MREPLLETYRERADTLPIMLTLDIPGRDPLQLEHLVLDLNGTLARRGDLVDGVEGRIARLASVLEVRILSADTFAALHRAATRLRVSSQVIATGADKERIVRELGADRCVAIGNGANDERMLAAVALPIAVIGPEGASGRVLARAELVCTSIVEALDLLLDERALIATLRL